MTSASHAEGRQSDPGQVYDSSHASECSHRLSRSWGLLDGMRWSFGTRGLPCLNVFASSWLCCACLTGCHGCLSRARVRLRGRMGKARQRLQRGGFSVAHAGLGPRCPTRTNIRPSGCLVRSTQTPSRSLRLRAHLFMPFQCLRAWGFSASHHSC